MDTLKIKKLRENAKLPFKATNGSAGMDLYACVDSPVSIAPGEIKLVPTGIAIALPNESYVAYIYARSGLAIKHGICLANSVGVVDSDYRGEVCVGLCNISKEEYTIDKDERIAQLVVAPVCSLPVIECEQLDQTERASGGFGSTGKN